MPILLRLSCRPGVVRGAPLHQAQMHRMQVCFHERYPRGREPPRFTFLLDRGGVDIVCATPADGSAPTQATPAGRTRVLRLWAARVQEGGGPSPLRLM